MEREKILSRKSTRIVEGSSRKSSTKDEGSSRLAAAAGVQSTGPVDRPQ